MRARFARLGIGSVAVLLGAVGPAFGNGMLGIFFDQYGQTCASAMRPGSITQMFVVFLPDGDTRSGITGAEFLIEAQDADGYLVLATQPLMLTSLGDPFDGGTNVVNGECLADLAIPVLSVQIQSTSGGENAKFVVKARNPPVSPEFPCALVTLCDGPPIYTAVCVETGKAVINPTGGTECGSNSESAEWGRIKELYR